MVDTFALAEFVSQFRCAGFIADASRETGIPLDDYRSLIETFTNETETYGPLLDRRILPGMRVLEVGSGLGFLSLWLARQQVDITPLEPGAGAFDSFETLSRAIAGKAGGEPTERLRIGAAVRTAHAIVLIALLQRLSPGALTPMIAVLRKPEGTL